MLRCGVRWLAARRIVAGNPPLTPSRLASTKKKTTPRTSPILARLRRFIPPLPPLNRPPFPPIVRYLIYAYAGVLAVHICTVHVVSIDLTYGISMLPTLYSFGTYVLISKYHRRGKEVKVGDIISFKHPVKKGEYAIKRVIGMEGDFVLRNTPGKSDTMIQIPEGHCWVVGDNLMHSRDSRMFGPLPLALVHGKILAKWTWSFPVIRDFAWIENGLQPSIEGHGVD